MKKWIQAMHMKKGALHKELDVPMGEKIPMAKLEKAAHKKGVEGKRARLAETLEGLHHGKEKSHEHHEKMMEHHKEKMMHHKAMMKEAGKKGDKKLHKEVKAGKKELKVKKVMHEFKEGKLHSGSKKGPEVVNPKQAIAIALSESRKVASKKSKNK